ncbi:hypothetical protein AKJ16_DCAP21587, partial [Drosera capensis]
MSEKHTHDDKCSDDRLNYFISTAPCTTHHHLFFLFTPLTDTDSPDPPPHSILEPFVVFIISLEKSPIRVYKRMPSKDHSVSMDVEDSTG